MNAPDFTTTIRVDQTPKEAFDAINNPRAWWSEEITGATDKLNDVWNYHYQDVHRCRLKVIESIPNQKVVWLVEDNYFQFTKDKNEWIGTKMIFDIAEKVVGDNTNHGAKDGKTRVRFTHQGLVPEYECYDICQNAWTTYINTSLYNLITTGKGQPNGKDKPQTEDEKRMSEVR